MQGRIIKGVGGFYYISHNGEVIMGTARGILKRGRDILYVGDIVEYEMLGDDEFVITGIMERRNYLNRPPVSNLDKLIVCFAATAPEPNLYTVDKMCVGAEARDIDVIICITKADLTDASVTAGYRDIYKDIYPTVVVSAEDGSGVDELVSLIEGSNAALAGASGVGKSTLFNRIVGYEAAETGDISDKRRRGKHTTRHVEIFELDRSTCLYDTPGFTSLDAPGMDKQQLGIYFPEIREYAGRCRYSDCIHVNEPDCAVKKALSDGGISAGRYDSYKAMLEEVTKWHK